MHVIKLVYNVIESKNAATPKLVWYLFLQMRWNTVWTQFLITIRSNFLARWLRFRLENKFPRTPGPGPAQLVDILIGRAIIALKVVWWRVGLV